MISRLRKTGHLFVFSPINDLSQLSRAGALSTDSEVAKARAFSAIRNGSEIVGDEWSNQIVMVILIPLHTSGIKLTNTPYTESNRNYFENGNDIEERSMVGIF